VLWPEASSVALYCEDDECEGGQCIENPDGYTLCDVVGSGCKTLGCGIQRE